MTKSMVNFAGLPIVGSLGSLDAYKRQVNTIPMLTAEEELSLSQQLHDHGDLAAAKRLVMSHLRFVVSIARGYDGYGLSQADLIQEGNIGLMKAVKRFNPAMGVRLVSFAVHWIKSEMHEFILRNWRIVKIATTKAQRKLFFNLRKMRKRFSWFSPAEVVEVAKTLNVKPEDVRQMEARLSAHDEAFDAPFDDSTDDFQVAPADYLEDERFSPSQLIEHSNWSGQREQNLQLALKSLDERSQDILQRRWLAEAKITLQDLAKEYQVSAERIRQIEKQAMDKLKAAISD